MLNTPSGVRFLDGSERLMFLTGAESLAKRLIRQMEEETGLPADSKSFMSGKNQFHSLLPAQQLLVLRLVCIRFLDVDRKFNIDSLMHGAIECTYSWLAHQISEEIADELTNSSKYRKLVLDFARLTGQHAGLRLDSSAEKWVETLDALVSLVIIGQQGLDNVSIIPTVNQAGLEAAEDYFMNLLNTPTRRY